MRLNTELINARNQEIEHVIQKGIQAEKMVSEGESLEGLQTEAKKVLELSEDSSLQMEAEAEAKKRNVQAFALLQLSGFTNKAKETGLVSDEELAPILAVEKKIAEIIAKRLDLEVEELYTEDEE